MCIMTLAATVITILVIAASLNQSIYKMDVVKNSS